MMNAVKVIVAVQESKEESKTMYYVGRCPFFVHVLHALASVSSFWIPTDKSAPIYTVPREPQATVRSAWQLLM
jgi:hypothetical protein